MPAPAEVTAGLFAHLDRLDRAAPGLVGGLYVTGSTALGDFVPGRSDVDFVAVLDREPGSTDLDALADAHAELVGGPDQDGVYLTRSTLAEAPDGGRAAPHSLHGVFSRDEPCFQLNPISWLELSRYGIPVRGPEPATLGVPERSERLRAWLVENLRTYWQDEADTAEAVMTARGPDGPARGEGMTWLVLGPPRLLYTLRTGDVLTKSAAGAYVGQEFPEWKELADRCVRWRHGEPVTFTATDALAAARLTRRVIDSI